MENGFREYLEQATKKILEITSSKDVGEEERASIIGALTEELRNNIENTDKLDNSERLIYSASAKYIDQRIGDIYNNPSSKDEDFNLAISLCKRQKAILNLFTENRWERPIIENSDLELLIKKLTLRQETNAIIKRLIENDKSLSALIHSAQEALSAKHCDKALELLPKLDADIKLCKSKRIPIPYIKNADTKVVKKQIVNLKDKSEQRERLYEAIRDVDSKLNDIISSPSIQRTHCIGVETLCERQNVLLSECRNHFFPIPLIKFKNLDEISERYKRYSEMITIDECLSSNRNTLSSKKGYAEFYENCNKQIRNLDVCKKNGWAFPTLMINDPLTILNKVKKEEDKKDTKKIIIGVIGLILFLFIAMIIATAYAIHKYKEDKIQIPFDSSYAFGKELDDIYDELVDAGFENISKREDYSGWFESNKVTKISIKNSDIFSRGSYRDPNVSIVINYSSSERSYITEYLKNWRNSKYTDIQETLQNAGFTNVSVIEEVTHEKSQDQFISLISLNGNQYTNEQCYIPLDAPIVIKYYTFKIILGNNSQFIGRDYKNVLAELNSKGFTNIQKQEITDGWAKGNSVVEVLVNNDNSYSNTDSFYPNAKIVIKYSSDDRMNVTSILEKWKEISCDELKKSLEDKGVTKITVISKNTKLASQDNKITYIAVGNEKYSNGECYLSKSAEITIERYLMPIVIGGDASSFEDMKYTDVVAKLNEKGFTNIQLRRSNNLINGWVNKEGTVKSISVNGNSKFKGADSFYHDTPIIIVVYTFEDEGCDEITDKAD